MRCRSQIVMVAICCGLGIGLGAAAQAEEITVTGFIPAPRGIYDEMYSNVYWDWNDGDVDRTDRDVSWYLDPSDETRSARLQGNTETNQLMIGDVGGPPGEFSTWRGMVNVAGPIPPIDTDYALVQSSDYETTLINKRAGAGRIGLQSDGNDVLMIDQDDVVNIVGTGAPMVINTTRKHPTDIRLQMDSAHDTAARDYWIDSIRRWASDVGSAIVDDPPGPGEVGPGDGDWLIINEDMVNLNRGKVHVYPSATGVPNPSGLGVPAGTLLAVHGNLWVKSNNTMTLGGTPKSAWPRLQPVVDKAGVVSTTEGTIKRVNVFCDSGYTRIGCSHNVRCLGGEQKCVVYGTEPIIDGCQGLASARVGTGTTTVVNFWAHCAKVE